MQFGQIPSEPSGNLERLYFAPYAGSLESPVLNLQLSVWGTGV